MKIIFLFLLLLDDPEIEAQQGMVVNGQVLLRFIFHPFYNGYEKLCSKLHPERFPVVNTRGYVNDFYKGRISTTEYNGGMDVTIWNLKPVDAGDYRCVIVNRVHHIYSDYRLQIDHGRRSGLVPPGPRVRSTIRPSISSSSSSSSSDASVFYKHHNDGPSVSRSFGVPLAAGLCVTMVIVICSIVVAVVHRKVEAEKKCGATSSDSAAHTLSYIPQEESSIIYITVDFKPHENHTTELYANLQTLSSPRGHDPDPHREPAGTVVYSTLASNQR
ncbi:uncharacterized protein LOC121546809 isoform X1 [Coregonus clupeaformis]|uniref:uncharacterized protein LOC121546809 isoform X1 n=2 Tax=Coregonus clupeaformis TaxID=59861 RepID=UPI001BE027FF|nr:uncharacterized protein LOC121546809 isoform X1 [Coregonus clupeaformis]XP_041713990.1 uncharacterized protein LOC121546809 isoform X1 [Coregonus clupeaformis]